MKNRPLLRGEFGKQEGSFETVVAERSPRRGNADEIEQGSVNMSLPLAVEIHA